MAGLIARLFDNRLRGRATIVPVVARVLAGIVFVAFSLGKFTDHQRYIEDFVTFGLPESSLLVYLVGLLELGGGLALIVGFLTRLAALGLGLDMVGAVVTAGVQVGGPIHLGLAPALAVVMFFLIWSGPGPYSVDARLARRLPASSPS